MDYCSHISPLCSFFFPCRREPGIHSRHILFEETDKNKWIQRETTSQVEEEDETMTSSLWGEWGLLGQVKEKSTPTPLLGVYGGGCVWGSCALRREYLECLPPLSHLPRKVSQISGINPGCFRALPHLLICSGILGNVLGLSLDEVLFLFVFFFWLRGMWDLSSLTKDQTCAPCTGSVES